MSRRFLTLITALACIAGVAACSEDLESGAGCPALCPQQPIELRDTLVEAIVIDSTVAGFPAIGFEESLLLANHGDSLETRVIVRFDSLPGEYTAPNVSTPEPITFVDSATIRLKLTYPLRDSTTTFTVLAYDVDTLLPPASTADTMVSTLAPLFRPERLLGSVTVTPNALTDSTIHVPISSERLLQIITDTARLRVGFAIQDGPSASVRLAGIGDASMLSVRFRVSADTTVPPFVVRPLSRTPTTESFTAAALADYQMTFRGPPPVPPTGLIAVGGAPGRRTYLRFDLPSGIVDSARVVRASLVLTQAPNLASPVRDDSVTVLPDVIVADSTITNLERLMRFTSRVFAVGTERAAVPVLRLTPAGSGQHTVEMAALIAAWTGLAKKDIPRALVLRLEDEGQVGGMILFHSTEAAAELRPRLRLTYAPRLEFGLP